MKKNIAIFLFLIFVSLLTIDILYTPKLLQVDTGLISSIQTRYALDSHSQEDYSQYPVYYPPVRVKLDSYLYQLQPLYEEYQLQTSQQEPKFFAAKRVNEIVTWGDSLPVLHKFNSVSQLLNWWDIQKQINNLSKDKYYSIDASLARYTELMIQQLNLINTLPYGQDQENKMSEFRRYIYQNQLQLSLSINKLRGNNKIYIQQINNLIYKYFMQKSGMNNQDVSNNIIYSLDPLINNLDFGKYDVTIDQADIISFKLNPEVMLGQKLCLTKIKYKISNDAILSCPEIVINGQSHNMNILNLSQNINKLKWTKNNYVYSSDISYLISKGVNRISLQYAGQSGVKIQIAEYAKSSNEFNSRPINTYLQSLLNKPGKVQATITKNLNDNNKYIILAKSNKNDLVPIKNLTEFNVESRSGPKLVLNKLSALNQPVILYQNTKSGEIIDANNISRIQEQAIESSLPFDYHVKSVNHLNNHFHLLVDPWIKENIQLLTYTLFVLWILSLISLFLNLNKLILKSSIYAFKIVIKIRNLSTKYLVKSLNMTWPNINYIIFLLYLFILIDILFIKVYFDPLIIFILVLLLTYQFIKRSIWIIFTSAIILLGFSIVLYYMNKNIPFEKAANWTYFMLCVGILTNMIENIINKIHAE